MKNIVHRRLIAETVTGVDGYLLYRCRSVQDNGNVGFIRVKNQEIEVDIRWIFNVFTVG